MLVLKHNLRHDLGEQFSTQSLLQLWI